MSQTKVNLPATKIAGFCQRHHIRQLSLFGSVLRDDFSPDSDIDLLVDFEAGAEISLFDLVGMQLELADLLQRPVDLVPRRGLKPLLKEEILATAEVIYAA